MARKFSFQLLAMSHVVQKYAFFVLQDYLTNNDYDWQLSFTNAAAILNTWDGIQRILPVFILYSAEQFVGHNRMAVISTVANCFGVAFIAMSTPPVLANVTGYCVEYDDGRHKCIGKTQMSLFFIGLTLVAVGVAGRKVMPKENGEDEQEKSRGRYILEKLLLISAPRILAQIVPIIFVRYGPLRFGIPAICTAVATFFFLIGLKNKPEQTDSAVTIVPEQVENQHRVQSTPSPRTLEEAAIISTGGTGYQDGDNTTWKVSAVLGMALRLLPLWLPCAICGIVVSNGNTYFVQQAAYLKSPKHISVSAILLYIELNTLFCKKFKKWTSRYQRKVATDIVKDRVTATPMNTIPSVMILAIICCVTAMKIEERRLRAVERQYLSVNQYAPINMSIFWMLLPFWFLSAVDAALEVEITELFEDEVPSSTGKYACLFSRAVLGCGFLLSVLLVCIVKQCSDWFQSTLNESRLDKYYEVLLVLSCVNLVVYSVVACARGCGQTAQASPDA